LQCHSFLNLPLASWLLGMICVRTPDFLTDHPLVENAL
jgi:hypothetical protein